MTKSRIKMVTPAGGHKRQYIVARLTNPIIGNPPCLFYAASSARIARTTVKKRFKKFLEQKKIEKN